MSVYQTNTTETNPFEALWSQSPEKNSSYQMPGAETLQPSNEARPVSVTPNTNEFGRTVMTKFDQSLQAALTPEQAYKKAIDGVAHISGNIKAMRDGVIANTLQLGGQDQDDELAYARGKDDHALAA